MKKRLLALLLTVLIVASFLTVGASAVNYDANAAVAYAAANWNNGVGVCDEFVIACLNAGGITLTRKGVGNVKSDVEQYGTTYELTKSGSSIYLSQNEGKIAAGDPIFYYCSTCGEYKHTVICGGINGEGKATAYGHNAAWNNIDNIAGYYDGYHHSGSAITMYVVHINSDSGSGSPDPTPSKPAAPNANVVTINYIAETLSYDSQYEVSTSSNFGSIVASGSSVTPGTDYYVRVKANGNTPPSDGTRFFVKTREKPFGDLVSFNYTTEEYSSNSSLQYSFDNSSWTSYTGALSYSSVSGHDKVYFRIAATNTSFASESQEYAVPTRGAAPTDIKKTDETVDQRNDGTITGVTNAMQYRLSGGSWSDCPESGTITGLADGTYYVRYKSTTSALASNEATVVIAQGVPQTFTLSIEAPEFDDVVYNYERPDAEALTITSTGNTDSTITSVVSDSENFAIGSGSTTVPYGKSISDWTVQPVAGLEAGTYTATITVTYNNGATETDTVSFTVDKAPQTAPAAPEIARRNYTSITLKALEPNANGAVAEYRMDGGAWQTSPVFEKLVPGRTYTFEQRYAAVGSYYASPASASAKFQTLYNIPEPHDIVIADPANGTVSTSLSNASKGAIITVTVTPDTGYTLGSLTVTGPDGNVVVTRVNASTYRFTMPDGDVTVRAAFTRPGVPFTDVATGAWYYDAVNYVYTNGLMDGVSDTLFNADGSMTRAMVWAILARMDGQTVTGANWATAARNWAVREGVSDGENANGLVTREQLATMIWRYVGEPASTYSLAAYTDANSVSDWASTAMAWAVENGIITGVTATTLVPQGTASRAQCAAILMRCVEL